jgi:hypothetical protein
MRKWIFNTRIRIFGLIVFCIANNAALLMGENVDTVRVAAKYTSNSIGSTFKSQFPLKEDEKDFKGLRKYFVNQSKLVEQLHALINTYSKEELEGEAKTVAAIKTVGEWLKNPAKKGKVQVDIFKYYYFQRIGTYAESYFWASDMEEIDNDSVNLKDLEALKSDLDEKLKSFSRRKQEYMLLSGNIQTAEDDLALCEVTINEALMPERDDQKFKTNMSLVFASLIGILLSVFFIAIMLRGDRHIANHLLSELGLQFITIFVLIIAVILFGILDILKGSELAAILAGISGYILGSKGRGTPPPSPEGNQGSEGNRGRGTEGNSLQQSNSSSSSSG